jgi:membrane fusion protein, multidrug efflux system
MMQTKQSPLRLLATIERRFALFRYAPLAVALVMTAFVLTACGRNGAPQGPGGFPPAPVSTMQVQPVTVPVRFEYVGQTEGAKEAEVRARVQGILEKRTYQEGGQVRAGQTLFVIDRRPYAAQLQGAEADLARATAMHAQAKRHLDRLKPLVGTKAISQREYDEAVSADETSAAAIKQAEARLTEARLNLSYTTVTAPVSGYASRAQKSEGSLVSPGADSLLTTISQVDPMKVNFSLSERELMTLNSLRTNGKFDVPAAPKGNPANGNGGFSVAVRLADGSTYPIAGKLAFVDARINPATGAFDAQAEIPNPDSRLHPGQFVRVVLEGAKRPNVIVVPQRAVMDGPQGKFVYVAAKADGKDVALPKPVQVGEWVQFNNEPQWIIESGLQAGDTVIVDGTAKIFPIPGGAPIMLGPPPGIDAKAMAKSPAKGEVKAATN